MFEGMLLTNNLLADKSTSVMMCPSVKGATKIGTSTVSSDAAPMQKHARAISIKRIFFNLDNTKTTSNADLLSLPFF